MGIRLLHIILNEMLLDEKILRKVDMRAEGMIYTHYLFNLDALEQPYRHQIFNKEPFSLLCMKFTITISIYVLSFTCKQRVIP